MQNVILFAPFSHLILKVRKKDPTNLYLYTMYSKGYVDGLDRYLIQLSICITYFNVLIT